MMELMEKMDLMVIGTRNKLRRFLEDQEGDTNFISVLVLLGIALALAGVFIGFKDKVLGWVDRNIGNFFNLSGGR